LGKEKPFEQAKKTIDISSSTPSKETSPAVEAKMPGDKKDKKRTLANVHR